ncbi:MAG: hypothetical protein IKF56_01815 [Eggerthellaceae bacterium]|nr:hypothetical protein [Eggerthellaceae bacterium]
MASYEIDRQRWAQLSIYEQLGNVSSEVGRAINATRAGKEKRAQGAIDRAVDLLDATVEVLIQQKSPRVKEVLRAREEFLRLFYDGTFDEDADNIAKYFNLFAIAARLQ